MTEINIGAAAPAGYVRAVFSSRCHGFAAPVDLMRAHLRGAVRLAMRRRVSDAFAGYLVTECADDLALSRLETCGRKYAGKVAPFSAKREAHQQGVESLCMTGGKAPLDAHFQAAAGGALDAPDCVPAGYSDSIGWMFGGSVGAVALREYISSEPEAQAFTDRRDYWQSYAARANIGQAGEAGAHHLTGLRDGFALDCLDAPVFMAAGSMRLAGNSVLGEWQAQRLAMRKGFWG